LFEITAFPTTTATMTLTATTTPLFMITAYPTTSPINVSATSTPLYYMTAYPSYNPNNNSGLDMLAGLIGQAPSSVATILGGVAVGIVGLGALGFAVNYLRKGGSIKGLFDIAKSNAGAAKQFLDKAPLPDSVRAKVNQAEAAVADPRAQLALQAVQDPHAALQQAVNSVGLPPSLSTTLTQALPPSLTQALPPSVAAAVVASNVAPLAQVAAPLTLPTSEVSIPVLEQVANTVRSSHEPQPTAPLVPQTATVEMTADQLAAFKQFLSSK
jgi:hypothetical protein